MNTIHPLVPSTLPATVLGQGNVRIPTAGKIRAGIKVLTQKAATQPKARALYEQGVAAGKTFDQIEQAIAATLPELRHPLVPRNVPWFTVRGQDFPNPVLAQQILDAYGEDRGEGRHLYRFPVVFPAASLSTRSAQRLERSDMRGHRYDPGQAAAVV
ncbi:hypothetical protein [Pseudoxanthomonas sp. JBR18]|uniref:recombination directionality factor n=1 Tax=Pseudoxanthomonas sp. JBR18 TaxID=2969308 RepID=UPI00230567CC|nr:hypothetical protein [Pseudoxanthomonas sp. JBR18]WCE03603.1 hypothetical protein PJ250_16125 [Pseudoxanthomonas sp. JBR18]